MRLITLRAVSCQLLNLSTQLDNTNLGQPITKQYLILFSLCCKEEVIQGKTLKQNIVRSKFLNNFGSQTLLAVHGMKNFGV